MVYYGTSPYDDLKMYRNRLKDDEVLVCIVPKSKVTPEPIADTIKELKDEAEQARKQLAPPKRKFMDLFLDDNDVNEKAIIGFISFGLMTVFGICDLITAFMGQDLVISDTIYTSFVVVTLGAFGISEAGKAFGK